ncbi:MAG: hypothetical protein SFX73_31510 [Kofleriaceae bacterium]|nr:hypothetical protein [Kofleriaceae bacterium]
MRAARFLRYAALQFVVLTAGAMMFYAGGTWWDPATSRYELTHNFLSDLGMTRAFSGNTNYVSSAMFTVALASLGIALVVFAWTWRGFAFARGRARGVGHASALLGTLCGLCFTGIGLTPFDRALDLHNIFVLSGFSLLPLYIGTITFLMWRNQFDGPVLASSLVYFVFVVGYVVLIFFGPRLGTPHGHMVQVIGQKIIATASILHVMVMSSAVARLPMSEAFARGEVTRR